MYTNVLCTTSSFVDCVVGDVRGGGVALAGLLCALFVSVYCFVLPRCGFTLPLFLISPVQLCCCGSIVDPRWRTAKKGTPSAEGLGSRAAFLPGS